MPGTLSKEEDAAERKRQHAFSVLMAAGFLNLGTVCSTLTVRPVLLKKIIGPDPAVIGATTANWLAGGSALQLLLAPTLGKASDAYG